MARVNVGIQPQLLSDQHLIAESVEITMITGNLRKNGYQIKSPIPEIFSLGKGHINFFKDKLLYLSLRLDEVNRELTRREIKNSTKIQLTEFPVELIWGWTPTLFASDILRERIVERLKNPLKAKPGFHKYYKKPIENMEDFCNKILNSNLYFV